PSTQIHPTPEPAGTLKADPWNARHLRIALSSRKTAGGTGGDRSGPPDRARARDHKKIRAIPARQAWRTVGGHPAADAQRRMRSPRRTSECRHRNQLTASELTLARLENSLRRPGFFERQFLPITEEPQLLVRFNPSLFVG